ncbi:nitrogen-fixing NifU domain protein [Solidesulfovibrio carbinoliphilus subsp. oakridgensis]|uniref:Nitrogen-fixing NifU domain protein n=1 Tax=Solidesulfovibrio carbinoliphilus subsp. oakridgensis TaxID=694327 RepID=G7QBN3_9BACT|nr:iron-sulfur cluster assembly scaffold protein [Solidesulfovibrio carbinoliphilus]EHJ48896.1 nitrogen-fixing NifU domain protein [Solidesulfovibrio carbinoliphilus subsp. oakridgensis]
MSDATPKDPLDAVLEIFEQEEQAELVKRFGERGYAIWRDAPARPRLENPTSVGTVKGSCGDTIAIALGIEGERIVRSDFMTDGCASSCIAAATAAALARGKSLDEAVDIDEQAIVTAVGRFPDDDRHCAYLAAAAVREAVHRWMIGGEGGGGGREDASGGRGE